MKFLNPSTDTPLPSFFLLVIKREKASRTAGDIGTFLLPQEAIYAQKMLKKYSRPIDTLSPSERYVMRRDHAGEILDRRAMYIVSKNLGHSRIDVIAQSYIYY